MIRFPNVTGFVLAGGASRRMGRPKRDLEIGRESMLSRQLRLLRRVCARAGVVGGVPRSDAGFFLQDELAGCGPLGGILTGLAHTQTEYNLFVACDMPLLTAGFLRFLCARALEAPDLITAPASPGQRLQPLCAVYRRRARGLLRQALSHGARKTMDFCQRAGVRVIPWPEISRAGFLQEALTNVNRPGEFAAARRQALAREGAA